MTIGNQLIWDIDPFENLEEVTQPIQVPLDLVNEKPARVKPHCECGAQACGIEPYMQGHSNYCPVHHDNTPVM